MFEIGKKARITKLTSGERIRLSNSLLVKYMTDREFFHDFSQHSNLSPQVQTKKYTESLMCIVAGQRGDGSNARGVDFVDILTGEPSEGKGCSTVDQLNACKECGASVLAGLEECPVCGSNRILVKEDTKWLFFTSDQCLRDIMVHRFYFCCIFEWESHVNGCIMARMYAISTKNRGFWSCFLDYKARKIAKGKKKAPFNGHHSLLKFDMMAANLIYEARCDPSDMSVTTNLIVGRDKARPRNLKPLQEYASGVNLSIEKAAEAAEQLGIKLPADKYLEISGGKKIEAKRLLLHELQKHIRKEKIDNLKVCHTLCNVLYSYDITEEEKKILYQRIKKGRLQVNEDRRERRTYKQR